MSELTHKSNESLDERNYNASAKSEKCGDEYTYKSSKIVATQMSKPHLCNICSKKFTAKKNLLKHLRVIHNNLNEAEKLQVKKTRCPESNCLFTCRKMKDLRGHIEKYHEIKMLRDVLQFSDETGFLKWKKEEEGNSVASFVAFRKRGVLRNGTVKKILLCHRTGQYNPKGTGKHRLKSRGSCKIGGTCPAAMEVMQFPDGEITVSYYKTHLGHAQDVKHLQLSREERNKLSERIEQGFSLDAILEDVKCGIDPMTGRTKRLQLLSRKDLYNIRRGKRKIHAENGSNRERKVEEPSTAIFESTNEVNQVNSSTEAKPLQLVPPENTHELMLPQVPKEPSTSDVILEKLKRISEYLPKSHHLTPLQFEDIEGKLNHIIQLYEAPQEHET